MQPCLLSPGQVWALTRVCLGVSFQPEGIQNQAQTDSRAPGWCPSPDVLGRASLRRWLKVWASAAEESGLHIYRKVTHPDSVSLLEPCALDT